MSDINLITGQIFGLITQIFNLYTTSWLLSGFFMLWVFRRVARLFKRL